MDELAFHAWVLTGNALHELLRGLPANDNPLRDRIAELESQLREVSSEDILGCIAALPVEQRNLLIAICERCVDILADESESRLGVTRSEAASVLQHLRTL